MLELSKALRRGIGRYWHYCPACERLHPIPDESHPFNGDFASPTFTPSLLQTFVRWTGGLTKEGIGQGERQELKCHYHVTAGKIQFHADSWHKRTDIVAMPRIPEGARE